MWVEVRRERETEFRDGREGASEERRSKATSLVVYYSR